MVGKRYKVKKFLAAGGMQEVYVAEDMAFGRTVALKAPKDQTAAKRFDRSARVSAKVNHPNVAKTLDYIETKERAYLIEEYIDGVNLQERMQNEFLVLDPYLAAHVIHHLAKGVAASHHAEVVHRDLKPSNIIVSKDPSIEVIKITDFGIAKMAEQEMTEVLETGDESTITGSKTVLGAVPYLAPEAFLSPKTVSYPADVWSLGAILYSLFAGEPPFGSGLTAIPRICGGDAPTKLALPKRSLLLPLADELRDLTLRCLNRKTAERPKADEVVEICSSLRYSTATRELGVVQSYGQAYGDFGFILAEGGGEVFFHRDSFYDTKKPEQNQAVNFARFPGRPKDRAHPVLPLRENK